ncbi:MAG TPA: Rv2578c family radical SAM protein [Actinomycetota bacterium]|nr:Rv2578c family radical SAM protein [Actinomycetota bacterium]
MDREPLFELRRRTFDAPGFRGVTFIEVEAKTIINAVPGSFLPFRWTINPYRGCTHACAYCFARVTHTYLDMDGGRDFETKIVVKVNAPEVLRAQLASRRWKGEPIAMGTATDPYQRAEGRYGLMRGILAVLIERRNPFSILTKGTLILRDLDLLARAARVTDVATALSVGTLDEDAWRRSEPGTPHPRARLEAVRALNEAGVPCGVLVAPVLPGITDHPRQLRAVVEAAIEAGATHVSPILLHLRPGVRELFLPWLERNYPDLVPRYEELYRTSAYGPAAARRDLARRVRGLVRALGGLPPSPGAAGARWARGAGPSADPAGRPAAAGDRRAQQLTLV